MKLFSTLAAALLPATPILAADPAPASFVQVLGTLRQATTDLEIFESACHGGRT